MNVAAILKTKGRSVATADQSETLQALAGRLAQKKIGSIVIVGEKGRVAGILSERDIIAAVAEHGPACLTHPATAHMTRTVVTCAETDTIDHLMETMTRGRFRHLPVMDGDALVGIVSIGDIVKHHIAEVELEASALKNYLVAG